MSGKVEEHEVAKAAFEIWEKEGRPDGKSEEHWHRAREMLSARETFADAPAKPATRKRTTKAAAAKAGDVETVAPTAAHTKAGTKKTAKPAPSKTVAPTGKAAAKKPATRKPKAE